MKLPLPALGFCLALHLSAQDAPPPGNPTDEVNEARPAYRYLFVVDTSSAMSRQKDIAIDTVSKLILSGVGGRIRPGDAWGLWTFDDQLHTNIFPAQKWDAPQRRDVANRVFRLLRDQPHKKKKRHLDQVLAAISDEAKNSDGLTVFLFTDGTEPVKGSPFDDSINGILSKNASGMRKVKKPFVIVFVAQDGRLAADGVSPGGEPIFVPRLAKKPDTPSNTSATQAGTGTKRDARVTSQPLPAKRSLSVEEISQALREAQRKQTNATVSAPPGPLILRGTNTTPQSEPARTNGEASAPVPNGRPSPGDATVPPQPAVTRTASAGENASVPAKTTPTPPQQSGDAIPTVNPSEEHTLDAPGVPSASPQTAAVLQPEAASTGWKYLLAAAALLLVALTLAWLYVRSIRYVPRPSIISRSLDREKK
ncbi:MAG TPA: hypothetical protein VN887_07525 [Candidatus Angelobacter sp.]|nr:hypothetical protein [Candidatus Angelobacter sp.]